MALQHTNMQVFVSFKNHLQIYFLLPFLNKLKKAVYILLPQLLSPHSPLKTLSPSPLTHHSSKIAQFKVTMTLRVAHCHFWVLPSLDLSAALHTTEHSVPPELFLHSQAATLLALLQLYLRILLSLFSWFPLIFSSSN